MSAKLATEIAPTLELSQLMPTLESFLLKLPDGRSDFSDLPEADPLAPAYGFNWDTASLENTLADVAHREQISPERFTLETGDILRTRNALKFATKLFSEHRLPWGPTQRMESCAHVAEVGTLLAIAQVHPEVIQAGFLYPTMIAGERVDSDRAAQVIEKKFGPEVLKLVTHIRETLQLRGDELIQHLIEQHDQDPIFARRLATLHCAVVSARSPSPENEEGLGRAYMICGVPVSLVNQFHIDGGRSAHVSPSNHTDSPYSLHDTIDIRNALRCAAVVFQDSMRKWGPTEKIPLVSHAAEVGLLLVLTGRPRDTVVAGLLHDFLEGYSEGSPSSLVRVVDQYGHAVRKLVVDVTEPNRSEIHGKVESRESWLTRKLTIVKRILEGSTEFAELVAATKISTLAAGNKMLFENGAFNNWSNGSCQDNIEIFVALCEACGRKSIHPLLADQLELEIDRLILQSAKTGAI